MCTSKTSCYKCKIGYSGEFCNKSCPPHCKNNICAQDTNVCEEGCQSLHFGEFCCESGMFGQNCSLKCIDNCKICESHSTCTVCLTGYYGETCSLQCPTGCSSKGCEKQNGYCYSCKPGRFGDFCTPCPQNCSTCESFTYCTYCENGYYGDTCSKECSAGCFLGSCNKPSGTCNICKQGYYGHLCCEFGSYGPNCGLKCPRHCRKCTSDKYCSECETNYFGMTCTEQCPDQCINGKCNISTGVCTSGCYSSHYGPYCCPYFFSGLKCNLTCPNNCKVCDSNNQCQECNTGYFGEDCSHSCSPGCKDYDCHKSSGACTNGCSSTSYVGDKCCDPERTSFCLSISTCPQNCKECIPQTGQCLKCETGFFADNCSVRCPDKCKDGNCYMSDGRCLLGCQEGYYGEQCESQSGKSKVLLRAAFMKDFFLCKTMCLLS